MFKNSWPSLKDGYKFGIGNQVISVDSPRTTTDWTPNDCTSQCFYMMEDCSFVIWVSACTVQHWIDHLLLSDGTGKVLGCGLHHNAILLKLGGCPGAACRHRLLRRKKCEPDRKLGHITSYNLGHDESGHVNCDGNNVTSIEQVTSAGCFFSSCA